MRDASRLAGISWALLEWCDFTAPHGVESLEEARRQVSVVRGALWPPAPGDALVSVTAAAAHMGIAVDALQRMMYDDRPGAKRLTRVPTAGGHELLARYNLELARAVLRDATPGGAAHARRMARRVSCGQSRRVDARVDSGREEIPSRAHRAGGGVRCATNAVWCALRSSAPVLARTPGWRVDADVLRNGGAARGVLMVALWGSGRWRRVVV